MKRSLALALAAFLVCNYAASPQITSLNSRTVHAGSGQRLLQ